MTRILFPSLFALALTTGCLGVQGNGDIETRSFELDGYSSVSVGSAIATTYKQGEFEDVKLTADSNLFDELEVDVQGDRLVVRQRDGLRGLMPTKTMRLEITSPSLEHIEASGASTFVADVATCSDRMRIDASGASEVHLKGVRASALEIESSGASHVHLAGLDAASIELDSSGASFVKLEGDADELVVEASGGSELQLSRLVVTDAEIAASGGSDVELFVTGTLRGEASGASDVIYEGGASQSVETSGGASVTRQ